MLSTLVVKELHPPIPSKKTPLIFYSNQSRHDLKRVYFHAIHSAKTSLFLKIYALSDKTLLDLLTKKGKTLPTQIFYDPSASPTLEQTSPLIQTTPIKGRGLMHQKIMVIDNHLVFLGSANLTSTSLKMHDNLVIGFDSKPLAAFLQNPMQFHFTQTTGQQTLNCYQLPDQKKQALNHLISLLDSAQVTLCVAMFTLTHPELLQALIRAHERRVIVKVALDHYAANGASQKAARTLLAAGIPVLFSKGKQLLHHKWAFIDGSTLIMGSANWTKSAFSKNQDTLLSIEHLSKKEKKFMNNVWKSIERESQHQKELINFI